MIRSLRSVLLVSAFVATGTIAQKVELTVQMGHAHSIEAAMFSKDGKLLVTGDTGRGVKVWLTATGQLLRSFDQNDLHGGDDEFWQLNYKFALSSDSKYLAVAYGQEDEFLIWSVPTGKRVSSVEREGDVVAAVFTDHGDRIAFIERDLEDASKIDLRVAATATGATIGTPRRPTAADFALFDRGALMSTPRREEGQDIFLTRLGARPTRLQASTDAEAIVSNDMTSEEPVLAVAAADGRSVAVDHANKSIGIHSATSGALITSLPLPKAVVSCALSHSAEALACLLEDGSVVISDDRRRKFETVAGVKVPLHPMYDDKAELADVPEHTFIEMDATGNHLAVAGADGVPVIATTDGSSKIVSLAESGAVRDLKASPDGRRIAFRFRGTVSMLGADSVRTSFPVSDDTAVDLSTDLEYTSLEGSGSVRLVKSKDGANVRNFEGATEAKFVPGGHLLVVRINQPDDARRMLVWDIDRGVELWTHPLPLPNAPKDPVFDARIGFAPDGTMVLDRYKVNAMTGVVIGPANRLGKDWFEHEYVTYTKHSPRRTLAYTDEEMVCVAEFIELKTMRPFVLPVCELTITPDESVMIGHTDHGEIKFIDIKGNEIATLVPLGDNDWVVATPEGRFDTDMDLSSIRGLHWIASDDPLKPRPLEIYMRQYFEPGLLKTVLDCSRAGNCSRDLKALPGIVRLNRVQAVVKGVRP